MICALPNRSCTCCRAGFLARAEVTDSRDVISAYKEDEGI